MHFFNWKHGILPNYILISLLFFSILIAEITIFFLSKQVFFILSHVFYFPIIFVAFQYPKRGVLYSTVLALIYLVSAYLLLLPDLLELVPVTMQFYVYVSVGVVVSVLSGEMKINELKYRSIFNSSASAISIVDTESHQILEANPKFAWMLGIEIPRTRRISLSQIWQDATTQDRFFTRLEAEQSISDYEVQLSGPGGKAIDLILSAGILPGNLAVLTFSDITARKREEEILRKSEEWFRELTDSLPQPVFETDIDGLVLYANRSAFSVFGYTPEDFRRGLNSTDIIVPEERERAKMNIKRLLAGKQVISGEYTAMCTDGSRLPVLVVSNPIFEGSRPVGIRGIIVDLSDRKHAEERSRENIRNLEFLTKSAIDFVEFTYDANIFQYIGTQLAALIPGSIILVRQADGDAAHLTIAAANGLSQSAEAAFVEQFGAHPVGMSFALPPDAKNAVKSGNLRNLSGGISEFSFGQFPPEACWRFGESCSMGTTYSIGLSSKGTLFGDAAILLPEGGELPNPKLVTAFVREASVALQRWQSEGALRESEEKYRVLFDSSTDGIVLISDTIVIDCNEQFCRLFGHQRGEVIGKTLQDLSPQLQPDGKDSVDKAAEIISAAREGTPQFRSWQGRRKDGTRIDLEVSLKALNLHGEDYVFATVHDVTEQKRAERALAEAHKKSRLLSGITRHDLLNQITVLLGYLNLAEEIDDIAEIKSFLPKTIITTERLRGFVEFTRDYEQMGLEAPRWQVLQDVVRRAQTDTAANVLITLPDDLVEIYADPLLEKVFYNLFDNALRHGGSDVSEIAISFEQSGNPNHDHGIIVVADNGAGIPADQKDKIFRRGHGSNTGLGLFLVREILHITGIEIRESGEEGRGARFEIIVPAGNYQIIG